MSGVLLTVASTARARPSRLCRATRSAHHRGELLGALQAVDPRIRHIRGASRTDAGVHARGQRVAFDTQHTMPARGWVLATARHLPDEISIRRAATVPEGFTPRFQSRAKHYRYLIPRQGARPLPRLSRLED